MNRLDKIEARANAATEGPWEVDGLEGTVTSKTDGLVTDPQGPYLVVDGITMWAESDAEFIAHARADVPWLLGQVKLRDKALEAVLEMHELAQPITAAFGTQEGGDYCRTCVEDWPCPTVETIRRHLGDDL